MFLEGTYLKLERYFSIVLTLDYYYKKKFEYQGNKIVLSLNTKEMSAALGVVKATIICFV